MSSTDSPTKSWWSLYKASSNKDRQNSMDVKSDTRSSNAAKHSSGLKSIAVAIGLKSKRPSKDPLYPVDGSQPSDTTNCRKSPSTHSPVASLDQFDTRLRRPRQSLLTLADDPFAGHPPIVSVHQSPVPSRLSVYSSPSVTDLTCKFDSPVYRSSYGSSSTNSNSLGPDLSSMAMSNSHRPFPESKKLHLKFVSGFFLLFGMKFTNFTTDVRLVACKSSYGTTYHNSPCFPRYQGNRRSAVRLPYGPSCGRGV
jgi:hypothetical protein